MTDDVPIDPPHAPAPRAPVPLDVHASVVAPGTTSAKPSVADRDAQLATAREAILRSMRERHALKPPLSYALLGGGLMLMLVFGVVLAVVLKFLGFFVFGLDFSVTAWLILYLVALVPFLVWTERRARGGFFTFASGDVDVTRDSDGDDYLLERGAAHLNSAVNALLWPPRAFVAGLHAVRGVPERGLDLVLPEAADTLTLMLTLDGGVKIKDLVPADADPMGLMPVLKWLDAHDYIGISTKGDRVWVSSPAKKRFVEEGIRVPKVERTP